MGKPGRPKKNREENKIEEAQEIEQIADVEQLQEQNKAIQQTYHTSQGPYPFEEITKSGMKIDELTKNALLALELGGIRLIGIDHTFYLQQIADKRKIKISIEITGE